MATLTFSLDVPDTKNYNYKTLQEQLTAFARILLSYAPSSQTTKKEDMHIFDCFSGNWGGDKDSHQIADELRENRIDSRIIETW